MSRWWKSVAIGLAKSFSSLWCLPDTSGVTLGPKEAFLGENLPFGTLCSLFLATVLVFLLG